MKNQFPFQIIDGFLAAAGRVTRGKPSFPTGCASDDAQLARYLVGDATDHDLLLVLKGFQKRINALLEDRNSIGRKLHDCVLRPLVGISLGLEARRRSCTSVSSEAQPSCGHSLEQLNTVIRETRRMIRGLEEGGVQEFDLMSELYSLIKTYEPLGRLDIELIIQSHTLDLLTQEEKHELFTITREALNNCVRHADATRATVKLHHSKSKIRLAILDNGIGFSSAEHGYGLSNMETCIRKLGGRLRVGSQKGRGTKVIAEFELEPILTPL